MPVGKSLNVAQVVDDLSLSTREKVRRLRRIAPALKGIDLARLLGVSRERIRQLLVDLGLSTRSPGEKRGGNRRRRRRKS
jgi:hypothetical protein